jgi:multisubunit Na+/H+ antiporter MnhG subunit
VRKSASPVVETAGCALFSLLLIIALNGIRISLFPGQYGLDSLLRLFSKVAVGGIGVTLGALAFCAWVRARMYLVRAVAALLLVLSPFGLLQLGQAAHLWYTGTGEFAKDKPPALALPAEDTTSLRIVWVVFDELDYHLTWVERPGWLQLPEFDRLRTQAIHASGAFPPANYTGQSMPALITGRLVASAEEIRMNELLLVLGETGEKVAWSSLPNVFSAAREMGFNTGLAGWWHPYCRIIGDDLTTCFNQLGLTDQMTVADAILDQALGVLPKTAPLLRSLVDTSKQYLKDAKRRHLHRFRSVMTHAKQFTVDPSLGLVLIHYPIPHPPGIYDRHGDELSVEPGGNYLDNCRLADRALGELRQAMEEAGLWDKTVVLVTSDHHWRPEVWKTGFWTAEEEALAASLQTADHRVPYLLKLAGQTQAHRYDETFNTVITHDLLLALLRGKVASADSVVMWLDQHRSGGEIL